MEGKHRQDCPCYPLPMNIIKDWRARLNLFRKLSNRTRSGFCVDVDYNVMEAFIASLLNQAADELETQMKQINNSTDITKCYLDNRNDPHGHGYFYGLGFAANHLRKLAGEEKV